MTDPLVVPFAHGVFNLRDLGPVIAASSAPDPSPSVPRPDTTGRVFRADGLHRTDEAGRRRVADLGVRCVIDLRSPEEAELEGRYRHPLVEVHALPVVERLSDFVRQFPDDADDLMLEHYHLMAEQGGNTFARALHLIADSLRRGDAVAFHCAAGKDRTGILAALLLAGLGVDDQIIADDYGRSAAAMAQLRPWLAARRQGHNEHLTRLGVSAALMERLYAAEPTTMLRFLASLRQRHGSIDGYLAGIGADDAIGYLRTDLTGAVRSPR